MSFNAHKKIFAITGVLIILTPLLFLSQPKKAEAVVPVIDLTVAAAIKAQMVQDQALLGPLSVPGSAGDHLRQLRIKEVGVTPGSMTSFDGILWALVKILIGNMVNNITIWVQGGFQGNPLFIQNMEAFLLDAGVEASGLFLEKYSSPEIYDLLCNPWKFNIALNLKSYKMKRFDHDYECTILDVINNVQGMVNFMTDFRSGGWDAWISLADNSSNNPYSSYLEGVFAMEAKISVAEKNAKTEATMNLGFLGIKECDKWIDSGEAGVEPLCARWTTHSPGSWIEDQVSEYTTSGLRTLEIADEIDELIGALISQLANWIIGGLSGDLSSDYYKDDTYDFTQSSATIPNYEDPPVWDAMPPPDTGGGDNEGSGGDDGGSGKTANVVPKQIADTGPQGFYTALVSDGPSTIYYTTFIYYGAFTAFLKDVNPTTNSSKYIKAFQLFDNERLRFIVVSPDDTAISPVQEYHGGDSLEKAILTVPMLIANSSSVNYDDEDFIQLNLTGSFDQDSTNQIVMYEWDLDYDGDYDWWAIDWDRDGTFEDIGHSQGEIGQDFIEFDKERGDPPGIVRVRYETNTGVKLGARITDNEGLYKELWFAHMGNSGLKSRPPPDF